LAKQLLTEQMLFFFDETPLASSSFLSSDRAESGQIKEGKHASCCMKYGVV